jgi:hypothetical protein
MVLSRTVPCSCCCCCCYLGKELRAKGLNRIGNMLVPNSNYCLFEDWIMPLLDDMLKQQQEQGTVWTPSKVRQADVHRKAQHAAPAMAAWGGAHLPAAAAACAELGSVF